MPEEATRLSEYVAYSSQRDTVLYLWVKDCNTKIKKEPIMNYAKGVVKTECFYWQKRKNSFGYMNEDEKSLSNFLKDVSFVNTLVVPGANILILFYIK